MCHDLLFYPMSGLDGFNIDTLAVAVDGEHLPTTIAIHAGARKNYFIQ